MRYPYYAKSISVAEIYDFILHTARKEKLEKLQDQERKYKADFRKTIENKVTEIMNNVEKSRLELEPMNKIQRSIV